MTDNETGLTVLSVDQTVSLLTGAYVRLINENVPFSRFPSVMLWGPPGIGKSQSVREIAENITEHTGKRVNITDVRLLLFNPVDLRGIPTANEDRTLAVWLMPKIFSMDASRDVCNILLLDEITAAPQSVQAAAYQITLDRVIGEHRLPENCIVIAAGNRITDRSVAYNMPRALANRLLHIEIKGDADSWHDWAVKTGIHKYVTSYLKFNPTALLRSDGTGADLAFPTPRSWEMVSRVLTHVSDVPDAAAPLVSGCIGAHTAVPFLKWCSLFDALPDVEKVFRGEKPSVGNSPELQTAFESEMVSFARSHPEKALIDNSIRFAVTQPWSFRTSLLHDYSLIPSLLPLIRDDPVYADALKAGIR